MQYSRDIFTGLCNSKKIERDAAVDRLRSDMSEMNDEQISQLETSILESLTNSGEPWEAKQGCLSAAAVLVARERSSQSMGFLDSLETHAISLLQDDEVRVRLAAGELLGSLCHSVGTDVFKRCKTPVLELIQANLERQLSEKDMEEADALCQKLIGSHKTDEDGGVNASRIFHESAGWRSLETSMKCLQSMIDGCDDASTQLIDQPLLDLMFATLSHQNRFVRETGYLVCSSIVKSAGTNSSLCEQFGSTFARHFALGLADNWSQVRLAASHATRNFMTSLPLAERDKFYDELLPPMCLNRYYLAEGVRLYNQETWRLVVGEEGRHLVGKHINAIAIYYCRQTEADNHAVREAACHSIAELALKIDEAAVKPFVPKLIEVLMVCFDDDSWPVRDAACIACGNFISCYPDAARDHLDRLYGLFYANLSDCIPSVREGAAVSLAKVVKAYGPESSSVVLPRLSEGLKKVEEQEGDSSFSSLDTGPAEYGVAKRRYANEDEAHTDQTMYSCGSLAPKMGRGGSGCSDCKFRRPPSPWEVTDGCVHLFAELCFADSRLHGKLANMMLSLSEVSRKRDYAQHVILAETLLKRLPTIAKSMDKRYFKPMVEEFLEPIFYALKCGNQLTEVAAQDCIEALAKYLGPNVFRAKIQAFDPKYVADYDALIGRV